MNFNATLRLNSTQFKKGVADVQRSLNSLKSSFLSIAGALGAGLGLTQLISNLKNTAVQLSVAKNTLENVSTVTKQWTDGINTGTVSIKNYRENLSFVKKLANDYSQDLVALMQNFAQFHAACEKTNLDLENQKMVFESLTKAAAYYHMSSDRTKDMMNAVTQMMSKGKVAAEELRRQLGNALPGAFNLMAAALGVSNAQLDDMMRKGQVLAADALPRFAAMLNTVTKDADFNSLQMSLNRLKNTWYELVESSGVEGMFNDIVNKANSVLASISHNIDTIKDAIKGLVVGILAYKLFDTLQQRGNKYFTDLEAKLSKVQKDCKKTFEEMNNMNYGANLPAVRVNPLTGGAKINNSIKDKELINAVIKYNDALLETARIKAEVHGIPMMSQKDMADLAAYNNKLKAATTTTLSFKEKLSAGVKTFVGGLKSIAAQVEGILMSMGAMAIVSAIIGGLTAIWSHVKRIREEWDKINNIVEDYHTEVKKADENVEAQSKTLRANLAILQDTEQSERARLGALKELNKQMGTTFNTEALDKTKQAYKDIVKEVERWCDATKLQAKIQVQARKGAEAEALIEEKKANLKANQAKMANFKWWDQQGREHQGVDPNSWGDRVEYNKLKREIDMDTAAIKNLQTVVDEADQALKDLGVSLFELYDQELNKGGGGGGAKGLSDIFENYKKDKQELTNQLREHAITQEEFNSELDKLVTKYWESAAATGQLSIEKILAKMDKGKTLTAMEEWYMSLRDAAEAAAQRVLLEGAAESIEKELEEAIERESKELQKEMEEWAEKADKVAKADLEATLADKPKRGKRDNLFDYKKTSSEIFGGEADVAKEYAKMLEDAIADIESKYDNIADASESVRQKLASWKKELEIAKKEASSLEEAMRIRQVQEDIDNLNKEINKSVVGGFKNLAQSTDRIIKGMETLRDAFDASSDATGWERFMAVFNEVVQIVEMFTSITETLNTISKASTQLEGAELAMQQQKITLLEREVALREAIRLQKQQETKATEEAIAADIVESTVSKQAASANAGEAIAGATASGAKLAFPYNLIAIAAGVAAVIAALASMSKFAKGGIVNYGSPSGDNTLARVNQGEMILSKHDQATLFNAIKTGKLGGGNIQMKVRGCDLVSVINNEMSRRRG